MSFTVLGMLGVVGVILSYTSKNTSHQQLRLLCHFTTCNKKPQIIIKCSHIRTYIYTSKALSQFRPQIWGEVGGLSCVFRVLSPVLPHQYPHTLKNPSNFQALKVNYLIYCKLRYRHEKRTNIHLTVHLSSALVSPVLPNYSTFSLIHSISISYPAM